MPNKKATTQANNPIHLRITFYLQKFQMSNLGANIKMENAQNRNIEHGSVNTGGNFSGKKKRFFFFLLFLCIHQQNVPKISYFIYLGHWIPSKLYLRIHERRKTIFDVNLSIRYAK